MCEYAALLPLYLSAGVFNEPTSDLTKLLSKLVDSNNTIMVPGWYDAVRHNTLTPALQRLDALDPPEFTLGSYQQLLGIPELKSQVHLYRKLPLANATSHVVPSHCVSRFIHR